MNVYKLRNGKTTGSFQLPIKNVMVPKEVNGDKQLKKIHYIPGAPSMWVEDYKGDDKPKSVWFEDGELRVPEDNFVLNQILQNHPWNGKNYDLLDEDAVAEKEIVEFETLTKASNSIIDEKDEYKIKATAMVIIQSDDVANWSAAKCKTELLKYARSHSKHLLLEMNKSNYESRFIAALAFNKEIIKYNMHRTAVVWNDEKEGVIVRLAEGEKGIDKLGEFLAKKTDSSHSVYQRIGEKVEDLEATTNIDTRKSSPEQIIPEKTEEQIRADERAKVLAEIALENAGKKEDAQTPASTDNTSSDTTGQSSAPAVTFDSNNIDQVLVKYKEVFGKDAPVNMKGNIEWLNNKIASQNT